jgi:5'-deoxynucleotidase YfbR-like HD superfamily hydrolase
MDKTVIDKAVGKKYTEFSDEVKQTLYNKLANHETSQAYAKEYDKIQDMKQKFAQIADGDTEE